MRIQDLRIPGGWEVAPDPDGRPGHLGSRRNEKYVEWNSRYGENTDREPHWELKWAWENGLLVPEPVAWSIYEDAYCCYAEKSPGRWRRLLRRARDIYDSGLSNLGATDYSKQEGDSNHYQDIAVRRVAAMMGWSFEGDRYIQIRHHHTEFGRKFSPGKVEFHRPDLILRPRPDWWRVWWDDKTVEDWYQSNKLLLVRK